MIVMKESSEIIFSLIPVLVSLGKTLQAAPVASDAVLSGWFKVKEIQVFCSREPWVSPRGTIVPSPNDLLLSLAKSDKQAQASVQWAPYIKAVKEGRSFVTNTPVLLLELGGKATPGDVIEVGKQNFCCGAVLVNVSCCVFQEII